MADREFDVVVVVGATGVTGRRVAAYLSRRAEETGRAGRQRPATATS
jgi:short subunit dehydrogenase-like uncharacterized protein